MWDISIYSIIYIYDIIYTAHTHTHTHTHVLLEKCIVSISLPTFCFCWNSIGRSDLLRVMLATSCLRIPVKVNPLAHWKTQICTNHIRVPTSMRSPWQQPRWRKPRLRRRHWVCTYRWALHIVSRESFTKSQLVHDHDLSIRIPYVKPGGNWCLSLVVHFCQNLEWKGFLPRVCQE